MATADILLNIDTKGAKAAAGAAGKISKSWTSAARDITLLWNNAGRMFGQIGNAIAKPVEEAAKFTRQINQMKIGLANAGLDVKSTQKQLVDWADKQAIATGKSMDHIVALQNLSVQMTGNADKTNEMVTAAMGMSEVLGIDAQTALRGLTQTLQGSSGVLGRYVPELREFTREQMLSGEAVRMMAEKYGPAMNASMATTSGQLERLSNIWFDRYLEAVGMSIADNQVLAAGLGEVGTQLAAMAPNMDKLKNIISDMSIGMVNVISFMAWLGGKGLNVMRLYLQAWNLLKTSVQGFVMMYADLTDDEALLKKAQESADASALAIENLERQKISTDEAVASIVSGMDKVRSAMVEARNATTDTIGFKGGKKKTIVKALEDATEAAQDLKIDMGDLSFSGGFLINPEGGTGQAGGGKSITARTRAGAGIMSGALGALAQGAPNTMMAGMALFGEGDQQMQGIAGLSSKVVSGLIEGIDKAKGAMAKGLRNVFGYIIEGLKDPEALKEQLAAIVDMLTVMVERIKDPEFLNMLVNMVVDFVVTVMDLLASPGFISDIISAFVTAVVRIVTEVDWFAIFKEVFLAIARIIRDIFKEIFTLGRAKTDTFNADEKHAGGMVYAHSGIALSNGGRRNVPIMAQAGEAVIPNAPAQFQGLSTDGNGRVIGGGSVTININAIDSRSVEESFRRGSLGRVLNDLRISGGVDVRGRKI